MPGCCLRDCNNRATSKLKSKKQIEYEKLYGRISFHRIPKDDQLRKLWMDRIGSACDNAGTNSYVCSLHFDEVDIDRTSLSCVRLRQNALPMILSTKANDSHDQMGDEEMQESFIIKTEKDPLSEDVNEGLSTGCNEIPEHFEELEIKFEDPEMNFLALQNSIDDYQQRIYIKFGVLLGKSDSQIQEDLAKALDRRAYPFRTVQHWIKEINEGRTNIEEAQGDAHYVHSEDEQRIVKEALGDHRGWSLHEFILATEIEAASEKECFTAITPKGATTLHTSVTSSFTEKTYQEVFLKNVLENTRTLYKHKVRILQQKLRRKNQRIAQMHSILKALR